MKIIWTAIWIVLWVLVMSATSKFLGLHETPELAWFAMVAATMGGILSIGGELIDTYRRYKNIL